MPLLGAAMSSYGQGGWGVGAGGLQGGGAFGMVNQAMGAMNQGVRQGGLGALAMFPLQQRDIQSQVAANMTPEEQTAMRFKLAMQTGQRLGLKGEGGFAAGARIAYGDEVAEQMMYEAKNPQFWGAQKDMIAGRRTELAFNQRAGDQRLQRGVFTGAADTLRSAGGGISGVGRTAVQGAQNIAGDIGNWFGDMRARDQGIITTRRGRGEIAGSPEEAQALSNYRGVSLSKYGIKGAAPDYSIETIGRANDIISSQGRDIGGQVGSGSKGLLSMAGPWGMVAAGAMELTEAVTGIDQIHASQSALLAATTSREEQAEMVADASKIARVTVESMRKSRVVGKERILLSTQAAGIISGARKVESDSNARQSLESAANVLALKAKQTTTIGAYAPGRARNLTQADITQAAIESMGLGPGKDGEKAFFSLPPEKQATIRQEVVARARAMSGPQGQEPWNNLEAGATTILSKSSEEAMAGMREAVTDAIEDTETKLDLTYNIGGWDVGGDKAGVQGVRALIGQADKKGFAYEALDIAAMAVAASADEDQLTHLSGKLGLKIRWMESKGRKTDKKGFYDSKSEAEFDKWYTGMREKANNLDPTVRARLGKMFGEGAKVTDIEQRVEVERTLKKKEQLISGLAGYGQFGGDINKMFQGTRGKAGITKYEDITVEAFVGTMGEAELKKMEAAGGAAAEEAGLMRQVKKGGKEGAAASAKLEQRLESRGRPQTKKVTSATAAGGAEAQKLDRSDAAVSDMQQTFANFGPAVDDFKSGAKMFREAMETEWLNRQKD